jgi:hypothetical protein
MVPLWPLTTIDVLAKVLNCQEVAEEMLAESMLF